MASEQVCQHFGLPWSVASSTQVHQRVYFYALDWFRGGATSGVVFGYGAAICSQLATSKPCVTVDLFSILSGFALGMVYDDRLNSQRGLADPLKRHFLSLYPTYLLGLALGLPAEYDRHILHANSVRGHGVLFSTALVLLLLLLSVVAFSHTGVIDTPPSGEQSSKQKEYLRQLAMVETRRALPGHVALSEVA